MEIFSIFIYRMPYDAISTRLDASYAAVNYHTSGIDKSELMERIVEAKLDLIKLYKSTLRQTPWFSRIFLFGCSCLISDF